MIEAGIALPRASRGLWIDFCEVAQHCFNRGIETVKVHAVEADLFFVARLLVVVFAQPADEVQNIGIAPHPRWETLETSERFVGVAIRAIAANVPVDAVSVWPIGLNDHATELLLLDQALRNPGAFAIKLMRAVTR